MITSETLQRINALAEGDAWAAAALVNSVTEYGPELLDQATASLLHGYALGLAYRQVKQDVQAFASAIWRRATVAKGGGSLIEVDALNLRLARKLVVQGRAVVS